MTKQAKLSRREKKLVDEYMKGYFHGSTDILDVVIKTLIDFPILKTVDEVRGALCHMRDLISEKSEEYGV